MDQLEKDVWGVIHMIETPFKENKHGFWDLSREELIKLLGEVYDRLGAIVM